MIILCDNTFSKVVWPALHDGNRFLIERVALSLLPKDGPDSFLMEGRLSPEKTPFSSWHALIAGTDAVAGMSALASAASERDSLVKIFTKSKAKVLWNQEFSEQNLESSLTQLKQRKSPLLVHLISHGEEDKVLLRNGVGLSQSSMQNIFKKAAPIEMLNLSSCRSGRSTSGQIFGLAGSGFQAGVKSVIANRWSVQDFESSLISKRFLDYLSKGHTKAEALAFTQVELIKGKLGDPNAIPTASVWAAPLLIGHPW